MKIKSFEEFLWTKNISVADMCEDIANVGGHNITFDRCMKENHCYGLVFASMIVFSDCPRFNNREWNAVNAEWRIIKLEDELIPFWSDKESLGKLNNKKFAFNEELL